MALKSEDLACWSCGESLAGVPMPLSRISECLSCRRKLHVCLMCEFYDPAVAEACREPVADEVSDKTMANFCDFFSPRTDGVRAGQAGTAGGVPSELDALFGGEQEVEPEQGAADSGNDDPTSRLEDLFGKKD